MSTTPVVSSTPAPAAATSKKSVLSVIGGDVKKVFSWLTSTQGQQVIATGEGVAEAIDPALAGIIAIANAGLAEVLKIEALAVAAGATGSGTQKAADVVQALTPQILAYAVQNKFPTPTATKIQTASNALVAFLDALDAK